MKKEQKTIVIENLGALLKEYANFYLVDVTAMNAETTTALRRECFKREIKMVVVKNTLLQKAFEASDRFFSSLRKFERNNSSYAVQYC